MTKLQAQIYAHVRSFIAQNGYSPTCAEIAADLDAYRGTVYANVVKLAQRGYLVRGKGWRNLRLSDGGQNARAA